MKFRILSMGLCLSALLLVMGSWAQESPKVKSGDPQVREIREETALKEKILARQFKEFQEQVLKLMQRLERSPRQEDKDRPASSARCSTWPRTPPSPSASTGWLTS